MFNFQCTVTGHIFWCTVTAKALDILHESESELHCTWVISDSSAPIFPKVKKFSARKIFFIKPRMEDFCEIIRYFSENHDFLIQFQLEKLYWICTINTFLDIKISVFSSRNFNYKRSFNVHTTSVPYYISANWPK